LTEFFSFGAQTLVAQSLNRRLELVGRTDIPAIASNQPLIPAAENAREKVQQLDVLDRKNAWLNKPLTALGESVGRFESPLFYKIDGAYAQLVLIKKFSREWRPAAALRRRPPQGPA
jgi:hypothetical protein